MLPPHLTGLLFRGVILSTAYVLLAGESVSAAPAPKSNRTMILGVWEVTKSEDGTPPKTTIEFTRDGKVRIETKVGDETLKIEGTYKVEDNKLTITVKVPDEEKESTDTATITKLTDKELIAKYPNGKTDEFKKKK